MNEWRECRWGDIATLEYGKGLRGYADSVGDVPVYGTNGPIGSHTEALCPHAGVVVGRKGAYRGIHYADRPFFAIDTAFYLKPRVELDLRWAYYELLTEDINGLDSGSAIPSTTRESFYALPVTVPPLLEQRAIGRFLRVLDDKIELNRRMNETLEAVAAARFAHDFRSSAGPVVSLGAHAEVVRGRSYASADLQPSTTALVTLKSFGRGGGYRSDGLKPYVGEYKAAQAVRPGEVVVACTDVTQAAEVIGRPALVQPDPAFETLVASLDVAIVRVKEPLNTPFLYFLLRTSDFVDHTYAHTSGTTVLHLSRDAIPSYEFELPAEPEIAEFGAFAQSLIDRIALNGLESRTLAALRDALLPKLISGELRIRDDE